MGSEIDWPPLVVLAWKARERAYSPYSTFAVGAALLTAGGEVFLGCNVENRSYGLTICAERGATMSAIQGGTRELMGIAIVADTEAPITPCGACRQFLAEFNPSLPIYSANGSGSSREWTLRELLPWPFDRPK